MRKVILALFVLFILQSCESEKDKAHKRIVAIDKQLMWHLKLKDLHEKSYNVNHEIGDTAELFRWRDSLDAVTGKLERERDSLEIILHGR